MMNQSLTCGKSNRSFAEIETANIDLNASQLTGTSDQSDCMMNQSLTYGKSNRSFAEIETAGTYLNAFQLTRTSNQSDCMMNQSLTYGKSKMVICRSIQKGYRSILDLQRI
jgi:hypothetical protein